MDLENLRYKYFLTEIFVLGQKAAGVRGFDNIQDYYTIQKQCLAFGKLFEDPEFPPTGKWLRPKEICKNLGVGSPKFFVEGVSRFDVKQGRLGDCWFLAAMAALTANKTRFNRIVCKDNSFDENYAGIFHFRFWLYGKWVEVVVDDRLPVNAYGQLNCLRSNEPNEFWSALLEKAYAKLFGGYEALEGGVARDAFEDFSGGVSEVFDLNNPPKDLFTIMQKAVKRGSMMSCALKPDPNVKEAVRSNGLVQGHAYSVTGASSVIIDVTGDNYEVDLVRIRNPWGSGEWKGSWSDDSVEWQLISDEQKQKLGITIEQDGEFWMSYQDFVSLFEQLELCTVTAQSLAEERRKDHFWDTIDFEGAWIKGVSAGGCRNNIDTYHTNPQFVVSLTTKDESYNYGRCNILVQLMQKYGRSKSAAYAYHSIGFAIYKIDDPNRVPMDNNFFRYNAPVERSIITNTRGITARFKLEPGHYVIIPSTFHKNLETEFIIRVWFENDDFGDKKLVFFKEANEHLKDANNFESGDTFVPCTADDFKPSSAKNQDSSKNSASNQDPSDDYVPIIKPREVQRVKFLHASAPDQSDELQAVEKLFKDAAGTKQEIGWMELKAILDGSIPKESRVKGIYPDYKNDGFSKDICRSIIAMMDTDFSRNLKLDEFKKFYATYAKWRDAFQKYNKSGTWKLSPQELYESLKEVGFDVGARVVNMLIYRYGTPYNTLLFEDFIMCAVKVTSMIERFKQKAAGNKDNAMFTMDDWITTTLYS